MEIIDNNYGKLAFKHKHLFWGGGDGSGFKHATFIKYRLKQIVKSKCASGGGGGASDGSEMKMIQK